LIRPHSRGAWEAAPRTCSGRSPVGGAQPSRAAPCQLRGLWPPSGRREHGILGGTKVPAAESRGVGPASRPRAPPEDAARAREDRAGTRPARCLSRGEFARAPADRSEIGSGSAAPVGGDGTHPRGEVPLPPGPRCCRSPVSPVLSGVSSGVSPGYAPTAFATAPSEIEEGLRLSESGSRATIGIPASPERAMRGSRGMRPRKGTPS